MKKTFDVVIIGAGAAGLACAAELAKRNLDYLILEARPRIGGRVLSVREESTGHVELGAEFIHGASSQVWDLAQQGGVRVTDVIDNHLYLNANGALEKMPEFFEHLDALISSESHKKFDQTVAEFLRKKNISEKWADLFKAFVEGFHAADLNVMGMHALAQAAETDDESLNGVQIFRPLQPYRSVLEVLRRSLDQKRIHFRSVVNQVYWKRGGAQVLYSSPLIKGVTIVSARKLVTTIPIGCLENEDISWSPRPRVLDLISDSMRMGHVQRLVFQFRERFWEELKKDEAISFLHSGPEYYFPTWWTQSPIRSASLVAWQGGPRALEMSNWSLKKKISYALQTLSHLTQRKVEDLESLMIHCRAHDWSRDPFSRGAYTYLQAGGPAHATALKAPEEQTLYFAGEGFCFDSSRGTVHGALKSGEETARKILRSLSPKSKMSRRSHGEYLRSRTDIPVGPISPSGRNLKFEVPAK